MANPRLIETVDIGGETIRSHEAYYVPATLDEHSIFCGDDRPVPGTYIQLFGGIMNLAYNQAVLEEAGQPGSVQDSLKGRVGAVTEAAIDNKMHPGVHSDTKAEDGTELREDAAGDIGCAYAGMRAAVSQGIAELGEGLVDEAARLRPDLFQEPEDREFGVAVTSAHGRLAKREGFQAPGRVLALEATSKGAEAVVLEGEHVASDGVVNQVRNSTLDSETASREGLPAYNHDAWAADEAAERLGMVSAADPAALRRWQIANIIDTLGTMHALGVEAIAIRG